MEEEKLNEAQNSALQQTLLGIGLLHQLKLK